MREIGGYFEKEQLICNRGEYYNSLISLNSARNSLVYIVKAKHITKIYLPYYLCDSVSGVCERENIAYEYYHIDSNFRPIFEKSLEINEYIYIVNFFGQLSIEDILKLKKEYDRIIIDNVQAFYEKPIDGIDTIYSCRKFFGVPDGAYLSTDINSIFDLPMDNSDERTDHIFGRTRDGALAHYEEFKKNDELFKQLPVAKMSELTHNMLSKIDYDKIRKIREENFSYLHERLCKCNKLDIELPTGPYMYPFYNNDCEIIRKNLINKKIYVPVLWPNVLELGESLEKDYAKNILPLPCDQRYSTEEMKIIFEEVINCINLEK